MSAEWGFQVLLIGLLLSAAAAACDRVAAWLGFPRRPIWAAAVFGSTALAFLSLFAPGAIPELGLLPDGSPAISRLDVTADAGNNSFGTEWLSGSAAGAMEVRSPLSTILAIAWLLSSGALLAAIGWSYRRLRVLRAASRRVYVDGVPVRIADQVGPAVVGLMRPEIILPRWVVELPSEERDLILTHEREHLAARDSWLLFFSTVAVALLPWSVFLWWQHHRLRQAIETDCDARVLARGADPRSYGQILIRTASSTPGLPLLNPAWGESTSQLERRIMTMTTKKPRHPIWRSIPLMALSVIVIAAACDVASRAESEPRSELVTYHGASDVDTVVVEGSATSTTGGDHGISGMSWPEGGGPNFADGKWRSPTKQPVIRVTEGGSAWKAGLRDDDVLLAVNGRDSRTLVFPFPNRSPGTRYSVRVRRGAEELEFNVEVTPRLTASTG